MKKNTEVQAINTALYDSIRHPLLTEKAMKSSENNQVAFVVDMNATKPEIKKAVEAVFGVKVVHVNTLCQKGKTKVFRRTKGVRSDVKKAFVTLAEGQTIDVTAGV